MNRKNKVLIIVFTILVLLLVDLVLNKSTTENISKEDLIIETIDSFGITTSTLDYIEELVFVEQINGGYVCVAVTYGKQIVVAYLETDIFQNDELWVSAYRKATLNVLLASTKSDFSKLYAGNMNSKKFYSMLKVFKK